MCGLVGLACSASMYNWNRRRETFEQLLYVDHLRGPDSAGIAVVPNLKSPAIVYKRAMDTVEDFMKTDKFARLMREMDKYNIVIGHNRATTRSNVTNVNAHPFQTGPVTLAHNGTIYNPAEIGRHDESDVDSASIAAGLAAAAPEEAQEVLERLRGGFSLVWHDARDGSLNFARNDQKPMYFGYVDEENTMFWGSEWKMLYWILDRNGYKIPRKFQQTLELSHYKFLNGNFKEYVRSGFQQRPQQTPTSSGSGRNTSEWTSTPRGESPFSTTTGSTPNSTGGSSGSPAGGTQTPKGGTKARQSAAPQTRKRLKALEEKLRPIGKRFGSPQRMIVSGWIPYPNSRGKRGKITGEDHPDNPKFLYEMPMMTDTDWEFLNGIGKAYGRVANIRDRDGKTVIVLDYCPILQERFLGRGKPSVPQQAPEARADKSTSDKSSVRDEDAADDLYCGPYGHYVTEEAFLALTAHGCGNCSEWINPQDHELVMWQGDPPTPICRTCQPDDSMIARRLGL